MRRRFLASVLVCTAVALGGAEFHRVALHAPYGALDLAFGIWVFWPFVLVAAVVPGLAAVSYFGPSVPAPATTGRRRRRAGVSLAVLALSGGFFVVWMVAIALVFGALLATPPLRLTATRARA